MIDRAEMSIWKRPSSAGASGTCVTIVSKSGSSESLGSSSGRVAMPAFALVKMTGKSTCSSLAPSSMKRSKTSLSTSRGRASCRSILLMTTIALQVELERLAQHEARLRHHALGGVDQQQHALDHLQHALDLAAEVGVAGRVDDVELDVAVPDRGVLGQDRDAAFAFERVGVHDARRDVLAFTKDAALPEHRIDERRLAVVDVGDDGDVAEIGTSLHRWCALPVQHREALGAET